MKRKHENEINLIIFTRNNYLKKIIVCVCMSSKAYYIYRIEYEGKL